MQRALISKVGSSCHHKWNLAPPEMGWRLAQCKPCRKRDAFPVGPVGEPTYCSRCVTSRLRQDHYGESFCLVCGNRPAGPTMTKREFLRYKGVRTKLSREEMAPVIEYASIHGITAASKHFKHPLSTVGKWAAGISPKKWPQKEYSEVDKRKALEIYQLTGQNFRKTARQTGIPRSTLQSWRERGDWYKAL